MEKLKEQISKIIVFKVSSMEELETAYSTIYDRLQDGYKRMSDFYFSEPEIKEVKKYGGDMLYRRYTEAMRDLKNQIRDNFEF